MYRMSQVISSYKKGIDSTNDMHDLIHKLFNLVKKNQKMKQTYHNTLIKTN